ncbi:S41 family peptidase [Empedobacter brevis]|uniref:S41 family peptidase n=1 Tax=Empedobacter brevis TaxID=247 RepID=UPI002FE39459
MIRFFLFICSSFCLLSVQAQNFKNDSIQSFLDQAMNIIEANSIHTENLTSIKHKLYKNSKKLNSLDQVAPLFEEVFEALNDYHGSLKYKGKTYGWTKDTSYVNAYLKSKLKEETNVSSLILDQDVAYIRIPGNNDFAFKKVDSLANDIVSHINQVNSDKIKGWIIDLRMNTGGNMYPILLGLKEFIGNELIFGGFINSKNQSTGIWEIKENKLSIDHITLERKTILNYLPPNTIPIVILTSGYTASAGEMTAISFIGRDHTYIVGEPTAHYTTAVQGFEINQFAALNLSTDYVVDRNKKVYKGRIMPDIEITKGDNFEDLRKDTKISQALKLLKSK